MVPVEIFSDPICPWCYIGKTWFYQALEAYPDLDFRIAWKPFQLNPQMPKLGMDRTDYLINKFGSLQKAKEAYAPIVKTVVDNNININFDKIKITPNTMDSQRLIYWAELEGIQSRVVSGIFETYFKYGEDIGDKRVLENIASKCGMNSELIYRLLKSEEDINKISNLCLMAQKSGITGIPVFLIDGTYAISGAQKPHFWTTVFEEILKNQSYQARSLNSSTRKMS